MTGEISLKGRALPIGGLKEKSMAAYKAGCKSVIIPEENIKDLADISEEVKCGISFIPVKEFTQVMPAALEKMPPTVKKEINSVAESVKDKRITITQ